MLPFTGSGVHLVEATEVTAGLSECNGSLLPGLWRDSLHVICGLTACTPGSAPGPTLGNEYRTTLPFLYPQNDDRIVTTDYVTSLRPMLIETKTARTHETRQT